MGSDKSRLSSTHAPGRVGSFTKESPSLRQSWIRRMGRHGAFSRRARVRSPGVILAAVLLLATGSATAAAKSTLPPGVHVDPGSPVAKEYAIPLDTARGSGGGSGSGQLFGRGITRAPTAAPAPSAPPTVKVAPSVVTTKSSSRPLVRRSDAHARPAARRSTPVPVTRAPASVPTRLSGSGQHLAASGTGVAWMLGVAVLVLAIGGLGGAVLARHGRGASARTS